MYKVFWILQRSLKCLDLHTTKLGLLYNSVCSYLCTLYKCGRHLMTHEVLYCLAATSANWHCVLCCGKVSTDDSLGLVQMYIRMYEAVHSLLLIPRMASPMSSRFCAVPSLTESTSWSCPHLTKNLLLWSLQRCIHTVPWSMATQPCLSPPPTPLPLFTTHTHVHVSHHHPTTYLFLSHHTTHTHHHPFSSHTPFPCVHTVRSPPNRALGSRPGPKPAAVKSAGPKPASATKVGAKGGPLRQVNSQQAAAAAASALQIAELQAEIATLQNQVCTYNSLATVV